ncbi:hypothetical protein QG37_01864 [Candidozyma auris]|uniref:Uncharacterized protein n=1 Tax=Candidozyma auris TaxID=498019 RepID=A0A0L0P3P8_CANAR|nr:hypothetical protein QG37_01864 [[Candida] auris]
MARLYMGGGGKVLGWRRSSVGEAHAVQTNRWARTGDDMSFARAKSFLQ